MPRLSDTQRKRLANNVVVAIKGEMAKQGLKRSDLEKHLPMSGVTYSKRLNSPGDFTLTELCIISNALNTTVDNLLRGRVSGLDV
jgi:hypothetical protein